MHNLFLRRDRRSAVAVLFAIMAVPILGLVGLAIDYGFWNQAYASMSLAATGAALNAVKVAASALLNADSNPVGEGVTAGKQWFMAQIGTTANAAHLQIKASNVSVTVTTGGTTSATVSYTTTVNPIFGRLFGVSQYPISVTASASAATNPYLEVVMLLDNSSSMDLGATPADMQALATYSPCNTYNAYYNSSLIGWTDASIQNYANSYSCVGYDGNSFDGAPACPVPQAPNVTMKGGYFPSFSGGDAWPDQKNNDITSYSCKGALPAQSAGTYPLAGPPCTFACHWDNNAAHNGNYQDLYGMARSLGVTLRFDLVKNATNAVLTEMQKDNISSLNNLSIGIYTFNTLVTPVYPSACLPQTLGCESGSSWTTAMNAVGTPPKLPATVDSGIQPVVGGLTGNNDDTNFPEAMNTLANSYVTAAGDGSTAAKARKVLFIVTDGMVDDSISGFRGPITSSICDQFKNSKGANGLGFQVYVVYTPYYPVMHTYYAALLKNYVEGTGSNTLSYQLQACSSNTNTNTTYYISAADQTTLNNALVGFLKQALSSPSRLTN